MNGIVAAIIALLGTIGGIILWYLKRMDRQSPYVNDIIEFQRDVRLSIKNAEKNEKTWKDIASRAESGDLSHDDANRLRSGKAPKDSV